MLNRIALLIFIATLSCFLGMPNARAKAYDSTDFFWDMMVNRPAAHILDSEPDPLEYEELETYLAGKGYHVAKVARIPAAPHGKYKDFYGSSRIPVVMPCRGSAENHRMISAQGLLSRLVRWKILSL